MGKSWDIEDPLESFFHLHQQKCIRQRYTVEKLFQLINLIGDKKHVYVSFLGRLRMRGPLTSLTKTLNPISVSEKYWITFWAFISTQNRSDLGWLDRNTKKSKTWLKVFVLPFRLTQGRHFVCFGYFESFGLCNKYLQYKNRSAAYF